MKLIYVTRRILRPNIGTNIVFVFDKLKHNKTCIAVQL